MSSCNKLGSMKENQSLPAREGIERCGSTNQMRRLFTCSVQLVQLDGRSVRPVVSSFVADRADSLVGRCGSQTRSVLWDSSAIQLGEQFFNEIIAHPVIPIDLSIALKALKRSPLEPRSVLLARLSHLRAQGSVAASHGGKRCTMYK